MSEETIMIERNLQELEARVAVQERILKLEKQGIDKAKKVMECIMAGIIAPLDPEEAQYFLKKINCDEKTFADSENYKDIESDWISLGQVFDQIEKEIRESVVADYNRFADNV